MTSHQKGRPRRAPPPLTVRLPDLPSVPADHRGKDHPVRELLTDGRRQHKLRRSDSSGRGGYLSFGMHLAPATESGRQLCASSSPGCRDECLYRQGRGKMVRAVLARVARSVAFLDHREWFERRLRWEVASACRKARDAELTPAFRLNLTSDVMWESIFPWLFSDHQGARFYDYTKHERRMLDWCRGGLPANYHLTFSRSETNEGACRAVLRAGGNVAVVFSGQPPSSWQGIPVIDGDEDDLRFLDPRNVVVGLRAKGTAGQDHTGFVVRLPLVQGG